MPLMFYQALEASGVFLIITNENIYFENYYDEQRKF
jgi:hypothetical protein